jgi:peptidylprolyl isomerase
MIRSVSMMVVAALSVGIAAGACTVKPEEPPAPVATGPIPAPPDVAAPPADASTTASGLKSKILRVGVSNVKPGPRSNVRVHYTGWTTDGQMFDSSVTRGEPAEFPLDQVIPGWIEGLQLMVVGEKRRFWIPGMLAYDGIPNARPDSPKGMLVFDIELLAVR